ncbi:MAG: haloacid dehalogenase type II [Gemmatimonadaceae bacterium]
MSVIVFDANETLLDLAALDPHFDRIFGSPDARAIWFGQVVELFLTASVVGVYRPFDKLASAALDMIAARRSVSVTLEDRAELQKAILSLPAHADVLPAFELLSLAGYRLAVLTNSTLSAITAQMRYAGLTRYLGAVLSADTVHRYKPSREAYVHAATSLGVPLAEIRLVAAHGWDVTGALAAGCRAAFVARPGKSMDPHSPPSDIHAPDLLAVARAIIAGGG